MDKLDFNQFDLKRKRIGVRISEKEKAKLDEYCNKNEVILSSLVRNSIRKVISEKYNEDE